MSIDSDVASQLSEDERTVSTGSTIFASKRSGPRPVGLRAGGARARGGNGRRSLIDSQCGASGGSSDESESDSARGSEDSPVPKKTKSGRAKRGRRERHYVFTRNNWGPDDLERFNGLVAAGVGCVYICFQGEIGSNGRTPHLQGVVSFLHARSMSAVQALLGGHVHLEFMRGTIHEARAYCCKPESRDPNGPEFREHGKLPAGAGAGRGRRTDCAALVSDIKAGLGPREIIEAHPALSVRCARGIDAIRLAFAPSRNEPTWLHWYYGRSGTGKSRAAAQESGDEAYWKEPDSIWWCTYDGQADVVIDDYRVMPHGITFRGLLRLGDRYPLMTQTKGGSLKFRAKRVFITSPRSPEETFVNESEDMWQLYRRMAVVKEFKANDEVVTRYTFGDVYVPQANVNVAGFVPNV